MSNLRVPNVDLPAHIIAGALGVPVLRAVVPDDTFVKAARAINTAFAVMPLRQIGLSESEIQAIVRFAEARNLHVHTVAADWLRCVMDTIETVG